jgi:thioredoxin
MEKEATNLYSVPARRAAVLEVHTPDEFRKEVLEAKDPTVAMFWATWCPFCRRFKPTFDKMAAAKPWRFVSVMLDDEANPLWDDYAVEVVPTLALFRAGDVAERVDGVLGYGIDPSMVDEFVRRVSAKVK